MGREKKNYDRSLGEAKKIQCKTDNAREKMHVFQLVWTRPTRCIFQVTIGHDLRDKMIFDFIVTRVHRPSTTNHLPVCREPEIVSLH